MILDGKLYLAPIGKNPQRVLDIGTGTGIVRTPTVVSLSLMNELGIWAIDFAE